MSNIVKALSLKYQSEIESARANIEVYTVSYTHLTLPTKG